MLAKRIVTMTVLLMLVITAIPMTALAGARGNTDTGDATEPVKDRAGYITTARGTSAEFDGGDYFYIEFGKNIDDGTLWKDASFGLLYGTRENPNSISIVAKHKRFIGLAHVDKDTGEEYEKPVPLFVQTVVVQKLDSLFEFNDTNGDGIANFRKSADGEDYHSGNDKAKHEPIYKRVSLATAWTPSEVAVSEKLVSDSSGVEIKEKTWKMSLTAKNLPYKGVDVDGNSTERLEKLKFTFYLTASLVKVNNVTIPQYEVTVREGKHLTTVMKSKRIEDRIFSGKTARYNVKYDHLIRGWDFYKKNENPYLLLEFNMIIGNYVPPGTGKWLRHEFIREHNRAGAAQYDGDDGTATISEDGSVDENQAAKDLPRRIKGRHIRLDDQWESIGRLTWVSNVTVDGEEDDMYVQIQGGRKKTVIGLYGGSFRGFSVIGGFSYPGGQSIFHDPEMSASMFLASSIGDSETTSKIPGRRIVVMGMIVVVGAVAAATISRKKPRHPDNPYERSLDMSDYTDGRNTGEHPDWERFLKR